MSKVIMVSRTFPAYHPRKGQPTYFIEKIWKSLLNMDADVADHIYEVGKILPNYQYADDVLMAVDNSIPKNHTIRNGKRWHTGDKASLRVWSGLPYRSPQITIAPEVELIVKDIEITKLGQIFIDGIDKFHMVEAIELAKNDGLSPVDFLLWIGYPFSGQILIWNNNNLPY